MWLLLVRNCGVTLLTSDFEVVWVGDVCVSTGIHCNIAALCLSHAAHWWMSDTPLHRHIWAHSRSHWVTAAGPSWRGRIVWREWSTGFLLHQDTSSDPASLLLAEEPRGGVSMTQLQHHGTAALFSFFYPSAHPISPTTSLSYLLHSNLTPSVSCTVSSTHHIPHTPFMKCYWYDIV